MRKVNLVNLCPHPVNFPFLCVELPACEDPPRLAEKVTIQEQVIFEFGGREVAVDLVRKSLHREGCKLPLEDEGTLFIVPLAIANAFPERKDLVVPDGSLRDSSRRIVGVSRLAVVSNQ